MRRETDTYKVFMNACWVVAKLDSRYLYACVECLRGKQARQFFITYLAIDTRYFSRNYVGHCANSLSQNLYRSVVSEYIG